MFSIRNFFRVLENVLVLVACLISRGVENHNLGPMYLIDFWVFEEPECISEKFEFREKDVLYSWVGLET